MQVIYTYIYFDRVLCSVRIFFPGLQAFQCKASSIELIREDTHSRDIVFILEGATIGRSISRLLTARASSECSRLGKSCIMTRCPTYVRVHLCRKSKVNKKKKSRPPYTHNEVLQAGQCQHPASFFEPSPRCQAPL